MHDYPLAHSRVETKSASGAHEVRILLNEGVSFQAWDEYRDLHSLGLDNQRGRARSIGLLLDFIAAKGDEHYTPQTRHVFFLRFAETLSLGSVHTGADPSGLWWMPRSVQAVYRVLNDVTAFTDWLSKENGSAPLNPTREASKAEQLRYWASWNKRKAGSLLRHIRSRDHAQQRAAITSAIRPKRRISRSLESTKSFPEERFVPLLRNGFARSSAARWTTLRDQMIAILLHGGGLRLSEPLHIWLGDVYEDPEDRTSAIVRVYHPSDGIVERIDQATGKAKRITRSEYLRAAYDRRPLTDLQSGKRVGWKNPVLTDRDDRYFVVFWRHPDYGRLFLKLHNEYVHKRPHIRTHPYLFVTSQKQPMTVKGYEKVHAAALRRIGAVAAKHLGTTPHGHRHAFGRALSEAGLPEKVIQVALHHSTAAAQSVYKEPDLQTVRSAIKNATASSSSDNLLGALA